MSAPDSSASLLASIPVDTRADARLFHLLAVGFIGIFLTWGNFARLDSGAIASGEVVPAGRVKTVQHLEGGIIRAIAVTEGQSVKAGAELAVLDDTEARALLAISQTELAAQNALVARLEAERDDRPYQPLPESQAAPSVAAQLRLFESRQLTLEKELAGLSTRLASLRQELASWEQKGRALTELRANAEEENRINQELFDKNFISRPRLLQLASQQADTRARLAENVAEAARVRQRIADTEIAIAKLRNDRMSELLEELRRAQDAAAAARERVAVAEERLARTRIRAPQDGILNNLRVTTIGGVVAPGGAVADIVPLSDSLQVEAHIQPDDIESVAEGRPARVRLTAYKARSHLSLDGKVVHVSGSTFRDESSQGQPYYKARIEISAEALQGVERVELIPGMLAQVEIQAGERSALRYLFDPVIDSMQRAFKES